MPATTRDLEPSSAVPPRVTVLYLLPALAALAALYAWEGRAYVEYSDGVYAYTSKLLLAGQGLYTDVAAAHPPPLYLLGGLFLAADESPGALRAGLSLVLLLNGGLVALAAWRLSASAPAAVVAGVASFFTPWALREHTTLIPETVAAPLLLATALLAARPEGARWAGIVGAVAASVKVAFALPVLAVVLAARRRLACLAWLTGSGVLLAAAFLVLFGRAGFDNVVVAQLQSGTHTLRYTLELWAQAAWNEFPLLALAALPLLLRARVRDPALLRTLVALTLGSGLLVASLYKNGSFLQILLLIEGPAVALGAAGLALLRGEMRASASAGRVALAGAAAVAVALTAAQSISVLAEPTRARLLAGPWSSIELGWELREDAVDAEVALSAGCPPDLPYGGAPYLAFAAGRPVAGNQPDQFITSEAEVHGRFRQAIAAGGARGACPR